MKVIDLYSNADDLRKEATQFLLSLVSRRLLRKSADEIGVSYFTLIKITNGTNRPSLDTIFKILNFRNLNVPSDVRRRHADGGGS